ncbi:MAG: hypothetical protein DMG14_04590 [Acidobacteria bacterium]|nr:MAG: hypothetical protein DMG14_04590 [Acidobacteriota bacterium]
MQARAFYICFVFACMIIAAPVFAQEGHPLVGSWHGNWGTSTTDRTDFTLIMDWDGKAISGVVNPGFEQMPLQNAKLNPKDWTVHFEIDRKEKSGSTARCLIDGKIDKLGSDRRTLTGTYTCGATKGDFKLTRDRDY